ncbi:MAG: D-2-hydroxyacid dehydrogenase [Bryobacterales bacterium]|nr:D-2-hydroxyacid dehydrogenase [Bryobacterales bacterium]
MLRTVFSLAILSLVSPLAAAQLKIVVAGRAGLIADMKQVAPGVTFVEGRPDNVIKEVADADAFIGEISVEILRAGKNLKWVHIPSAGVERYRFPELIHSNITLTNGKIIQGPEIADHAFALLLAMTRGINRAVAERANEGFSREGWKAIELRGKTAVIIGVGGIGSQIAARASAFGMTVIGVDPKDIPFLPSISYVVKPDRLDTVLPKADVVFVSAPHTPQSEKMIGSRQFELMKRGSYFIAVSRGKLYDAGALVKALDEKRVSGAGLDVTDPEPLPKGHPLWKFDNVIITPHIATVSDMVGGRHRELILENVARFAKGEPLRNVVDKEKGY